MAQKCLNKVSCRWLVPTVAIFVALLSDAVTKHLAENALANGQQISVVGGAITLHLLFNKGMTLGVGSSMPWLIAILVIIGSIALVLWSYRSDTVALKVSVGLAAGGALGNLADRIFRPPGPLRGAAIDWITLFHQHTVFNLADVYIRVGLIVALVVVVVKERSSPQGHMRSPHRLEVHQDQSS